MDISKLNYQRISQNARLGIINEFFPEIITDVDDINALEEIDWQEFSCHARALCLYSALLITKLHETEPEKFDAYFDERITDAKKSLVLKPKYASLSSEELDAKINEITMRDIRNCFAHGAFGISFSHNYGRLFFVLYPTKSEIVSGAPIVISADKVAKQIKEYVGKNSVLYSAIVNSPIKIGNVLDKSLKEMMLPIQMLKLYEHYTDKFKMPKEKTLYSKDIYTYIEYVLLSAKITYEQDEYYNLFGRDSSVFETISLIRNSLAHDTAKYENMAKDLSFKDKHTQTTESIESATAKLLILDSQKQVFENVIKNGNDIDADDAAAIKQAFVKVYDFLFSGENTFEEIIENAPTE